MQFTRRMLVSVPAALGLLSTVAAPLHALTPASAPADRTLFTWNGTVDREVLLFIRGRSIETRATGLDATLTPRLDVRDELPRQRGDIDVRVSTGRGSVDVVQQPTARNDFTAIVRLRDPRSGSDRYDVTVSWTSYGDGRDSRIGDRDRDRDHDGARTRDRESGRDRDVWDREEDRAGDRDARGRDDERDDEKWERKGEHKRENKREHEREHGNGSWKRRGTVGGDEGQLSWRGDVDDVAEIRLQGRRVEYRTRSGEPLRNVRYDLRGEGLPRRPITLALDVVKGRGSVIVVEQPNQSNGFTAILRVIDRRSGYGDYDFDLRWY